MGDQTTSLTLRVPEGSLGPAMKALPNDRQRAFVLAMLDFGTGDYTKAARAAGYGGESPKGLKVIAHRLAHDDRIQAAIQEEGRRRLGSAAVVAASVVTECLRDPDKRIALKAAEMVMNRVGLHPMTEHKVTVENQSEEQALRAR